MINRQATALTLTAISILFSSAAFADDSSLTASADMHVNLTVQKSCQINVADMDFGSHASDSGEIDVSADASVTCTSGTSYMLNSESGRAYSMKNKDTSETVAYNLYSDANRTSDLATTAISGSGSGSAQVIPIYGKVAADALVQAPAGDYADTVTLTVTY